MSEVFSVMPKLTEGEFCSTISPPKYAKDSLDIIGTSSKMKKNNTSLSMIMK